MKNVIFDITANRKRRSKNSENKELGVGRPSRNESSPRWQRWYWGNAMAMLPVSAYLCGLRAAYSRQNKWLIRRLTETGLAHLASLDDQGATASAEQVVGRGYGWHRSSATLCSSHSFHAC